MINTCTFNRGYDRNFSITTGWNFSCALYDLTGPPERLIFSVTKIAILLYGTSKDINKTSLAFLEVISIFGFS